MSMETTIEGRALRASLERRREQVVAAAAELAVKTERPADVSSPELLQADIELEEACTQLEVLDRRLDKLPTAIEAVREPDMYDKYGSRSFFADVVAAGGVVPVHGITASEATERLTRHSEYEQKRQDRARRVAVSDLDRLGVRALGADGSPQQRALSTVTAPGIAPPTWMLEAWATVSRAACPLRRLATKLPLPDGTLELHIPRFTSAAGVVPMVFENTDPPDDYAGTDSLVAPVRTIAGDGAVSQQLYDRGPGFSDEIALADFAESYGESLQQQLISGTGENGQLLGLMNVSQLAVDGVPGARLAMYTATEPTAPGLVKVVAQCAGQISDTRKRAPSAILMRGARWFEIAGSEDKNGESVLRPGTGTVPSDESGPYGPLCNLPVYLDEAGIPADLETNQDAIVLARTRDILLLEEDRPRFSAMAATSDAGELTVILQFHQYVAAFTNRYPSGIGQVRGTGLTVPAGF